MAERHAELPGAIDLCAQLDFGFLRLSGWLAWWMWGIVHIYFLIGMRNRLIVAIHWLWSYITFQRGARLITGSDN